MMRLHSRRTRSLPAPPAVSGAALAALVVAAGVAAGCDLPLDLPSFETEWEVTAVTDTIDLERLLPEGVRAEGGIFVVEQLDEEIEVRLGDVCELCTCFSGPIPRLDFTPQDWAIPLPPGLIAATILEGSAEVVLRNRTGFDLLRNEAGDQGHLSIQLTDRIRRTTLDSIRIETPFPPDGAIELAFDLEGLELTSNLVARVGGTTPGTSCDEVVLDEDTRIEADIHLGGVRADEVRVILADAAVAFPSRTIDLPRVIRDRISSEGADAVLDITARNEVGVEVEVILSVAGRQEDLFTGNAALFTPIEIPAGSPEDPAEVSRSFVLDLGAFAEGDAVWIRSRNRIVGERRVFLQGQERVTYEATLRALVPTG